LDNKFSIKESLIVVKILKDSTFNSLIQKGGELRDISFESLKKTGDFLPVSGSALGKGYTDNDEEDSDEEIGSGEGAN